MNIPKYKPSGIIKVLPEKEQNQSNVSLFANKRPPHYSPFSLEFKKITSSQLFDYGQNISFDIPIVGNFLYRTFLEIEIPDLIYSDTDFISNPEYLQYKQTRLTTIENETAQWTSQYTNIKLYCNIQIDVYIEVNKLLQLNNISLDFLKNRILNTFNSRQSDIYQYKLFIDTSIINSINILNYVLELTTFNIPLITIELEEKYNNINNYLNYYYSNLIYSTNEYNELKSTKILCKWNDYLGHYYFNYFELNINGFTIDNYSNDYLHIKNTHNTKSEQIDNYNKLIGNSPDIYSATSGSPKYIYTPLLFSYSNIETSTNALPLVGMINSSIKINTRVNDIKNIIYLQDWEEKYNSTLIIDIKRKDHSINENTNTVAKFTIDNINLPTSSIELILPQHIYRYHCTRINLVVLKSKYPTLGTEAQDILDNYGILDPEFNELVITLDNWIFMLNNIQSDGILSIATQQTLLGYHLYLDYNLVLNRIPKPKINLLVEYGYIDNYEKQIAATKELQYVVETHHEIILDINSASYHDSLNEINGLVKDIYVFTRQVVYTSGISPHGKAQYTRFYSEPNPIESIELKISNEYNLFEYYNVNKDTFNNVVSYNNLQGPVPNGVWYKTFSLKPNEFQPAGCINMNNIKGHNIAIILNNFATEYYENTKINPNKFGIEFKLIYTKYNLYRTRDGQGDLVYYA